MRPERWNPDSAVIAQLFTHAIILGNMAKSLVNLGGRPTAITDSVVRKLEDIFKIGGTVEEACSHAGIAKSTYYERLKVDEGFRTDMEVAQHYSDLLAKNVVIKAVKDDDLNTSKWWLEKREFRNSGNTNVAVQVNFGDLARNQKDGYGIE